jgi:hypothetical protein
MHFRHHILQPIHGRPQLVATDSPRGCTLFLQPSSGAQGSPRVSGHLSCHVTQRIFTDEDVGKNDIASEILTAAMQAKELAKAKGISLSETVELAVEKFDNGTFGYYFVDHDAQILFWPVPVTSQSLMNGVRGVTEKSHISERGIYFTK